MEQLLNQIEREFKNVQTIKERLFKVDMHQLRPSDIDLPPSNTYGIYRTDNNKLIGEGMKKGFSPCDLHLFFDTLINSVIQCGVEYDLNNIEYHEINGGEKVYFKIPYKSFEINTKMSGDIIQTWGVYSTGYDGRTPFLGSPLTLRPWCKNFANISSSDVQLKFKNTKSAQFKMLLLCDELLQVANNAEQYAKKLNEIASKPISKKDLNNFIKKVTGWNMEEYKSFNTKRKNILDRINENIAIELKNTGDNVFSLLQGVTRYASHEMANMEHSEILFNENTKKYLNNAHEFAFNFN